MQPFHIRLKRLRQAREMSLRALAQRLAVENVHVSHNAIAKWERSAGEQLPAVEVIAALARIFAVEPVWLIEGEFPRTTSKRLDELRDVELLTEAQWQRLLQFKRDLLSD